ncbi:MAG TPA: cyclase [Candidatus Dormibacteraeota bacterium]|nr:cyclase [Candidatus Dormibacteraeota bacterium]
MVAVIVRHRVRDYDTWKPLFDQHGDVRRQYGAIGHQLYRVSGDPQELIVVNQFADLASAQAFTRDPSLPKMMENAGVEGAPDIAFCEQVESAEYPIAVG